MADIASLLSRLPGAGGGASGAPGASPGTAPPPGGGPSPMMGAKPNVGPVTTPQPNAGNMSGAIEKIQTAVKLMEQALPMIPMGAPLHTEILQATTKLAKHMGEAAGNSGSEMQTLLNLARQSAQNQPMAALQRLMPQPGAPPAMPQPQSGGGAPAMPAAA